MHITDPTPDTKARPTMQIRGLNLWYGDKQALKDVSFDLMPSEILAFIGPSGCGKSTALKVLNRMHDNVRAVRISGTVLMHGADVYGEAVDPPAHRRRFGWVAQKPNPFFSSIWENVSYGPHIHGLMATHADMAVHVEDCLRRAHLWDEVKDHLHDRMGTDLSGGQQQRLCIARALSTQPEVLLMDEPTGSIDPIATTKIEELILELRANHSIVIITHSMMEARRISDRVAYFHMGQVLEIGPTAEVFDHPSSAEARRFISGQFG